MKQKSIHSLFRFLIIASAIVVFTKCSTNNLSSNGINYQYDNKIKELNPEFVVYHQNDTLSYLYCQINTSHLLYVRENSDKPFEAKVEISYELYSDYKAKNLIDSATKTLYDYKTSKTGKKILSRIPIPIRFGQNGVLKIVSKDFNKRIKDEQIIEINKSDKNSEQFFLFKNNQTEEVYFNTYFTLTKTLTVVSHFNSESTFEVEYFNTNYPASPPPFSTNRKLEIATYRDSGFLLDINNSVGNISMPNKGSYCIKNRDSVNFSVILQLLDSNFHGFHTYMGMIEPLKYICTSAEYKSLLNSKNQRKDVETLWLKMGGTKERTRVIIEEYYRRVELANKFFTSYKEGWKTDRGMLSIVMGMPTTIYKNRRGETWVYGTPHNMMMSLTFNFNLENEDKVKNDYQLVRYRTYRDYWYRACESWRQGRIYNFN